MHATQHLQNSVYATERMFLRGKVGSNYLQIILSYRYNKAHNLYTTHLETPIHGNARVCAPKSSYTHNISAHSIQRNTRLRLSITLPIAAIHWILHARPAHALPALK